jgi:hypothetical protein
MVRPRSSDLVRDPFDVQRGAGLETILEVGEWLHPQLTAHSAGGADDADGNESGRVVLGLFVQRGGG